MVSADSVESCGVSRYELIPSRTLIPAHQTLIPNSVDSLHCSKLPTWNLCTRQKSKKSSTVSDSLRDFSKVCVSRLARVSRNFSSTSRLVLPLIVFYLSCYRVLDPVSLFRWHVPDGAFAFYSFLRHFLLLYWVGMSSECNGLKERATCLGKRETT